MNHRWMLYSHDALGLGHVRRALALARGVLAGRQDLAALLVTCSPVADALPFPPGLDSIKLPSTRKVENRRYLPRSLRITPDHLQDLRTNLITGAFEQFRPHLLLVDKSPQGLLNELSGVLARRDLQDPRARLVLGWRDILDTPEAVRADWEASGALKLIERHYDEIWIFGDPGLFDARTAYALPARVARRVRYLGYVAPRVDPVARAAARERLSPDGRPVALVTVGGGEDGERLLASWLEASARHLLPADLRSFVVLGPCLPADVARRLRAVAPPGVTIETFLPDLAPWIAAADLVVAMGGYNTTCEILAARSRAVLVPRVTPRREQWLRARLLADRGLLQLVDPGDLSPERLAGEAGRALRDSGTPRENGADAGARYPRLDGLDGVVRAVGRLLPVALQDTPAPGPAAALAALRAGLQSLPGEACP